jgi:hypothetical protein
MKVKAYLDNIADDADDVLVPVRMAQDILDLSRSGVLDLVKSKRLDEICVEAGGRQFRGVTAGSLMRYRSGMLALDKASVQLEKFLIAVVRDAPSGEAEDVAINYAPVMEELGLSWKSPADRKTIGNLLGEVSTRNHDRGARAPFLLSAVVVLKATGLPSGSFFQLAAELDMLDEEADEAARRKFWKKQMNAIAKYYRRRK